MKVKANRWLLGIVISFLMASCNEKANISITNNIKNVRLESVSYGKNISVTYSLLPGETGERTLNDRWDNVKFPMHERVHFYMVSGDNRVLLYTKEEYTVERDKTCYIILTDETEVYNPMDNSHRTGAGIKETATHIRDFQFPDAGFEGD